MTDDELIAKYIERDPNKPGKSNAVISGYWYHIWVIIGDYLSNGCNTTETATGFHLPLEAVEAALAYYRKHKDAIDMRLDANNDNDIFEGMSPDDAAFVSQHVRPHVLGIGRSRAALIDSGVSVWAIIGEWQRNGGDIEETARAYDVSTTAVKAALAYYKYHRRFIDAYIEELNDDVA
jgi:uncharacterized protein (DUF433 family)